MALAYLSTHLKAIKAAHPTALHVDAGDASGGSSGLSRTFSDEPTIEALNVIGLDVQALGDHEFDGGTDELLRRMHGGCLGGDCWYRGDTAYPGAAWEALAGNVHDASTGQPLFPGTWTTEVEGVEIGFIGVTTTDLIPTDGNEGLDPQPWRTTISQLAPQLQAAGADVIVVLRHVGSHTAGDDAISDCDGWNGAAADFNRDQIDPAVDVVVDAHTHRAYVCDEPGVPLTTQAFHSTLMFTEIDLTFDAGAGELVERSATNRWVTHDVEPDPEVLDLLARYQSWFEALPGVASGD